MLLYYLISRLVFLSWTLFCWATISEEGIAAYNKISSIKLDDVMVFGCIVYMIPFIGELQIILTVLKQFNYLLK